MEFLGNKQIPFARVFTKSDKLSKIALQSSVEKYDTEMMERWESMPATFISSAINGTGRDEILDYIEESINNFSIET